MEWVKTVKIRVDRLPSFVGLLHKRAGISARTPQYQFAMIAHVRHEYTEYEDLLAQMADMPLGEQRQDVYLALKNKVNNAVVKSLNYRYGATWRMPIEHRCSLTKE